MLASDKDFSASENAMDNRSHPRKAEPKKQEAWSIDGAYSWSIAHKDPLTKLAT